MARRLYFPGGALALLTFLLPTAVVSCERRDEMAVAPDSIPIPRIRAAPPRAGAGASTGSPHDTASAATSEELAALRSTLEIPVQGITPAQLHDTFTEARGDHLHHALDILAARGTPVLSATDGRLLKIFESKAGGLMVYTTDASERFILFYAHLDSYAQGLTEGMRLQRGQQLGYVGTTGNAPPGTPHLHFAILRGRPQVSWSKGVAENPYPLLVPAKPSR